MTLTDTAASALLAVPPSGPRVAVFFKPQSGGRWKRVFTASDFASAVARIDGPGSWWLHELPDAADGPSLFDVPDEESLEVAAGGSR